MANTTDQRRIINIHLLAGYLLSLLLVYVVYESLFGKFYRTKCADNTINRYVFVCSTIEIFVITYILATIHFVGICLSNIF